jgi:predicted O-methyltransferase YrrM
VVGCILDGMRLSNLRKSLAARTWADKNIDVARQRMAVENTARFVDEHMLGVRGWRDDAGPHAAKLAMLRWAVSEAPSNGLVIEFGVATGETLAVLAECRQPVHGFDSFEGLPEDWYGAYQKGTFAQRLPDVAGAELHVGWFDDSLPTFLGRHAEAFAFVHMDADLYGSTKTVFDLAFDRFVPGTVIVFDEYFNYPGWQHHEHKAFSEFIEKSGRAFEYLGYNAMHEQVVVRLRS